MVARRHDLRKERLAFPTVNIEDLQAFVEDILIADAPDILKVDIFLRDGGAIDDLITVVGEIVAHVVKIAVASIEELYGIVLFL